MEQRNHELQLHYEKYREIIKGLSVEMIAEALKASINEVQVWLSGSARPV